ncbi:MAG: ATP/GTP-binding protein [Gemmatimonadota bacterium]
MATTNQAGGELDCKIVYYGPASSGKTTNLKYVYRKLDPATRGKLITPSTDSHRTLFFDFLSVDLGKVRGYKTRFHLYTVPGEVRYNESRRLIVRGVDGIVFVADSQLDRLEDNVESLANLCENLTETGRDLDSMPCVFQYNKRDLADVMPVAELEQALNRGGFPSFEAIAVEGEGVFETLKAVSKQVITSLS